MKKTNRDTRPLFVIKPPGSLISIDFSEFWSYRDLLYFLVRKEILVRYKQTTLGAAWAILQPLAGMLVLTVVFGRIAKIPSDGLPYSLFSYAGLVLWTFFAQAANESSNSLVGNVNLVTKVYLPRLLLPTAPVVSSLLDLGISASLLVILMLYNGLWFSSHIWALPIMLILAFVSALGVGIGLSALNVKYRDFRYVLSFLTQLWFFASPVVYPASAIPEKWRLLYALNPMVGAIEGFRWAMLGTGVDMFPMLLVSALSASIILFLSVGYFRRTERFFADVI